MSEGKPAELVVSTRSETALDVAAAVTNSAPWLREIVEAAGWPGRSVAGDDGAEAAWLILQHSIGDPELQRGYLPLLRRAAEKGEIPAWQPAYLSDRICYFEERPQVYGAHDDWDANGEMALYPVEQPERVDDLRRDVGQPPIAYHARQRERSDRLSQEKLKTYRLQFKAWARSVRWRK